MAVILGIGFTHHQHDLAARVNGPGGPPLAAIEHILVTVALDFQFHVGGIGRCYLGFSHGVGAANFTGQQRLQPLLLLFFGTVLRQHFHIAAVGGVAVEHTLCPDHFAHGLEQGGNFHVGQARAPGFILMGQKQVPQALSPGQCPQVVVPGRCFPEIVLVQTPLLPVVLAGIDMLIHKRCKSGVQLHNLFAYFKPHNISSSLCISGGKTTRRLMKSVTCVLHNTRSGLDLFDAPHHLVGHMLPFAHPLLQ